MRYFRTADDALYESVRLGLDAVWGHPSPDGRTVTCIDPAAVAPRDSQGRIVLAVNNEFCAYSVVVDLLPQLLAGGGVEEVDDMAYRAAFANAP